MKIPQYIHLLACNSLLTVEHLPIIIRQW